MDEENSRFKKDFSSRSLHFNWWYHQLPLTNFFVSDIEPHHNVSFWLFAKPGYYLLDKSNEEMENME